MTDRFTSPLPDHASVHHRSYVLNQDPILKVILEEALDQEGVIAVESLSDINANTLAQIRELTLHNLQASIDLAAAESSELIYRNMRLLHQFPTFAPLFRLLRVAELAYGVKRGGNSLLIGSGPTVPEALALYIEPPDEIRTLSPDRVAETILNIDSTPPLLDGKITAIEPDGRYLDLLKLGLDQNGIPLDWVEFRQSTLGEQIGSGSIPPELDVILWQKAEPSILYGPLNAKGGSKKRKSDRRSAKHIIDHLMSKLGKGGHLIITIGIGNNRVEYAQRIHFINDIAEASGRLGLRRIPFPNLVFESQTEMDYFAGAGAQTRGGIILAKS